MMNWKGKVFHSDLPEGSAECVLALEGEALVALLPDGARHEVPLARLTFTRQGMDGSFHVFREQGLEQPWLTTHEPGVLRALQGLSHPAVVAAVSADARGRRQATLRNLVLPLAALALLVAGCVGFVTGPLPRLALAAVPVSVDVELGKVALEPALHGLGGKRVEREEVTTPVRALLTPLLARVTEKGYAFELHVVDSPVVNAFALPGGALILTTGLLKEAGSPEEVAGVLAHEVAHVVHRHGMRSLLERLGVVVLASVLIGDSGGAAELLMGQAALLTSLRFSRSMEAEADRFGVSLLQEAGIDARGLIRFLEAQSAREGRAPGLLERFLSTHPVTSERIAELHRRISEQGAPTARALEVDWEALRSRL